MPPAHARSVLVATVLGSAMVFIDGTIVNVALPALQRTLGASVAEAQWVVEIYTLLLSSLLLVGGALGDHFGRRRIFAAGVATFAAASVWCGLAPTITQLIVARAVQGVAGALLTPGSLALISALFTEEERGGAIGKWSAWTGVATAVGPLLGGALIDRLSWRWAFFINAPIAAVVLALVYTRIPESRAESQARRLDLAGALLVTLGLGGIVYGLIESSRLALGAGAVGLATFIFAETRVAEPLVPLGLFRSRAFAGANLLTLLLYGALSGALFYLPFNLIQVHGYSATAAGASLLPFVALMFLLSPQAGRIADRHGPRLPLVIGPTLAAVGFALLARPGLQGGYARAFLPGVAVLGLGMATTVAPLTTTVMGAVDPAHTGLASGLNNAISRAAGLIAIAALGLLLIATFNRGLDGRLAALDLPPETRAAVDAQRPRLAAIQVPASVEPRRAARITEAVRASFVDGFRAVSLAAAGLALASGAAALLVIPSRSRRPRAAPARRGPSRPA